MSKELAGRITAYLASGGLFNPEYANHDAVRDLLIDCREALSGESAIRDTVPVPRARLLAWTYEGNEERMSSNRKEMRAMLAAARVSPSPEGVSTLDTEIDVRDSQHIDYQNRGRNER